MSYLYGQQIDFPCQWVTAPDSIKEQLIDAYGDNGYCAICNIHNIGVFNDIEFQNGVYCYRCRGDHFPQKLFVYYDNHLYVFKDALEDSGSKILDDISNCMDSLNIASKDSAKYVEIITSKILGTPISYPTKIKIKTKSLTDDILDGRWRIQVFKLQYPNKTKEWYRLGNPYVEISNYTGNSFDLYFLKDGSNIESDYKPLDSESELHLKKAFFYNNKLFLVLNKKYRNGTKGEYLLSKCMQK